MGGAEREQAPLFDRRPRDSERRRANQIGDWRFSTLPCGNKPHSGAFRLINGRRPCGLQKPSLPSARMLSN